MKSQTKQILIAIIVSVVVGLSFVPMFPDPYEQKVEPITFWEWFYRQVRLTLGGDVPA